MRLAATMLIAAALAAAAGCSSSTTTSRASSTTAPSSSAAPPPVTVNGTVLLDGNISYRDDDQLGSKCYTSGNSPLFAKASDIDDIRAGAQVVIADASGKTVGLGKLTVGRTTSAGRTGYRPPCAFHFTVPGVPTGSGFYKITAGTHSVQVTSAEVADPVLHFHL